MGDEIVSYAARFEGARGLKILKLEKDSAALYELYDVLDVSITDDVAYQPAAFDNVGDSTSGVSRHGFTIVMIVECDWFEMRNRKLG